MKIQINTDRNIEGRGELAAEIRSAVEGELSKYGDEVTRVEVHLSDQRSLHKNGLHEMCCVMEVRLAGRAPTAVTHEAATIEHAVDGAAAKLARSVEHILERRHHDR